MNEIDKTNVTDQTKFRVNKTYSKKLSKYLATFDYIDKILIFLSATSKGVCIFSSVSAVGALIGIAGESFNLFFFNNRNSKKFTEHNKKQK